MKLNVVIPVLNEAENIIACLDSIGKKFADKIYVIDSNSKDQTVKLANDWGAEVIQFSWNGKYPKKRNWYLLNYAKEGEWTMFMDADERLTESVKLEIHNKIQLNRYDAFWIPYSIYIEGSLLRFGYPLRKLALFKVGSAMYEKIEEDFWTSLDMEIHEHPIVHGKVGFIQSVVEHKVNLDTKNWVDKHTSYAKWEAKRLRSMQHSQELILTTNQKIKYILLKLPYTGFLFTLGSLILYRGILDGRKGIKYALLKGKYFNLIRKQLLRNAF